MIRQSLDPSANALAVSAQSAAMRLSPAEKAAIIIGLLGPESAKPIVENLDDRYLRVFINTLQKLEHIPRATMLSVVADFMTDVQSWGSGFKGGEKVVQSLASQLLPDDRAATLFGDAPLQEDNTPIQSEGVWESFEAQKSEDIIQYLTPKRRIVVAMILSKFGSEKAGEILSELPEAMSVFCVDWLSRDQHIDLKVIDAIAQMIQIEFLDVSQVDEGAQAATRVAEMLNIMPKARREMVMSELRKTDPEHAKLIEKSLMTFEDIPERLPTTAIPVLFRDFDQTVLIQALKAGVELAPKTTEFLYANISQRMATQYQEQVEDLADLNQKQADSAIAAIMTYIGRLKREGRITLIKREEDSE